VDNVLKEELGPFYIGIPGLYKAFFKRVKGLKEVNTIIFKKCKEGDNLLYAKGGWRDWPKSIEQDDVLELFNSLIGSFLGFIVEYRFALKI
jgi:hypothetical protein